VLSLTVAKQDLSKILISVRQAFLVDLELGDFFLFILIDCSPEKHQWVLGEFICFIFASLDFLGVRAAPGRCLEGATVLAVWRNLSVPDTLLETCLDLLNLLQPSGSCPAAKLAIFASELRAWSLSCANITGGCWPLSSDWVAGGNRTKKLLQFTLGDGSWS